MQDMLRQANTLASPGNIVPVEAVSLDPFAARRAAAEAAEEAEAEREGAANSQPFWASWFGFGPAKPSPTAAQVQTPAASSAGASRQQYLHQVPRAQQHRARVGATFDAMGEHPDAQVLDMDGVPIDRSGGPREKPARVCDGYLFGDCMDVPSVSPTERRV